MSRRFHRFPVFGGIVLTLTLGVGGQQASGRTIPRIALAAVTPPAQTATPLPASPAALPSARALLARMQAAVRARNSYHVSSDAEILIPSQETVVERLRGVAAASPEEEHLTGTARTTKLDKSPVITTVKREEVILVGSIGASRRGSSAWQCVNLQQAMPGGGLIGSLSDGLPVVSEVNLGPANVDHVPVWRVRVVSLVLAGGQNQRHTTDYFIARGDDTLVRDSTSSTLNFSGQHITEKVTRDYSHYGEAIQVELPAPCAVKRDSLMNIDDQNR